MKKIFIISLIILGFSLTGCDKKETTLECTQNDENTIVTIKNGKIISNSVNGEKEKVTDEEWETIKNFYEFTGDENSEEIAIKLKELNENIGYKCVIK